MATSFRTACMGISKVVNQSDYNKMYLYGYKMQKLAQLFKITEPDVSVLNTKNEDYTQVQYEKDIHIIYKFYKHPMLIHRMAKYDDINRNV